MNFILAAVLSNLGYALGDVANGVVSKANPTLRVTFWSALFSITLFAIPLAIFFGHDVARLNFLDLVWILGTGIIMQIGWLGFITGLNKGSVTLTGVIGGCFPAVSVIIALLIFKESISSSQLFAIMLVFVGAILASVHTWNKEIWQGLKSTGALYGFIACLGWGIYYGIIRIPIERTDWFLPQYGAAIPGIIIYLLLSLRGQLRETLAKPKLWWLIAITVVVQVAASMLYSYAITVGPISIVAPISGSSPAVFVVVAYFVFKEKLSRSQILGIVLALVGIVGLSVLG